jgi:Protein of unknown function (DUF2892)
MLDRVLRGVAGAIVLLSLALAHFFGHAWLWLTAFVGLNLFQSAFTNWCLMMDILKKFGVK